MSLNVCQPGQTSLQHLFSSVTPSSPSTYTITFPPSICAGSVVQSGFLMGYISVCIAHEQSLSPKTLSQQHVRSVQSNFFRPLFPAPQSATVHIQLENMGRAWSVLRFSVHQDGKTCSSGSMTMSNLDSPGLTTIKTPWVLSPPPAGPEVDLHLLERDKQPGWIPFSTAYTPGGFRAYHSYIHFVVPERAPQPHTVDKWVRPAWLDDSLPGGAVWTNELLHSLLDGSTSTLDNLLPPDEASGTHEFVLRTGLAQRKARTEGRGDWIWKAPDSAAYTTSIVYTSLAFQTEVKKRLPEEEVKWLFVRAQTKDVKRDKMDQEAIVVDEQGDLVAVSHNIMQVINLKAKSKKETKKGDGKEKQSNGKTCKKKVGADESRMWSAGVTSAPDKDAIETNF